MINMINITTGGIGISSENPRGLIKMIVDIITIIPTPSAVKRVLVAHWVSHDNKTL